MLQSLHAAWRARRVLLAGGEDLSARFMHSLLRELGARPALVPLPADSETLSRALTSGRVSCVIAPDLSGVSGGLAGQLGAIDMLLTEVREAGVPLVLLLSGESAQNTLRHPLESCAGVLLLGARFFLQDCPCTGVLRLGSGTQTLLSGEEARQQLLELERAAQEGPEAESRIIRAQTLAYLKRLQT